MLIQLALVHLCSALLAVPSSAAPVDGPSPLQHKRESPGAMGRPSSREEWCPTIYEEGSTPHLEDIQQKARMDCWWLAALASTAHADPEHLRSILPQPECGTAQDGTQVKVKLFDHTNKQVEITVKLSKTDMSAGLFMKGGMFIEGVPTADESWSLANAYYKDYDILWPAIMEAATLILQDDDPEISEGLAGGTAGQAFRLLYGKSVKAVVVEAATADLLAELLKTAIDTPMWLASAVTAAKGWIGNHAYSVLRATDDTVTVRDPYATDSAPEGATNVDHGTFDIPIKGETGSSCLTCGSLAVIAYLEL